MLTATVRDLHACYPGRFVTDVRTSCPDLWLHNPHLTPLSEEDPEVAGRRLPLPAHRPHQHRPVPLPARLHGVPERAAGPADEAHASSAATSTSRDGGDRLVPAGGGREGRGRRVSGSSPPEASSTTPSSGGRPARYQEVVEHFRGPAGLRAGRRGRPPPSPARRASSICAARPRCASSCGSCITREGAISAVSLLMHLAAAVPTPSRACRRAAPASWSPGGREPPHFTAYPHHQYLHTVGALRCCDQGGCWKSRTLPLGDGDPKDEELCVDVVGHAAALHGHDHRGRRDSRGRALLRGRRAPSPLRFGLPGLDPVEHRPVTECRTVKIRDVIAILEAEGWVEVAQVGSHRQFKHPARPGRVTVAGHPSAEIHPKTLRSIERQSGVKLR